MTTTLPACWKPRLACPFCGSNFLFTEPDEYGSGGQWVSPIHVGCNDCKAEQVGDTEEEAVSRWNARATPPASAQDEPITVSLDPDPRGVSVGVWQGSHCIYTGAHALPASVAPGDAQDVYHFEQRSRFGPWVEVEKPTAQSVEFVKRSDAPAAGDALDAVRYRTVRGSVTDKENGPIQMATASAAIGLAPSAWPTPDQFDAIADHIAAQQGKGNEA